MKKITIVLCSSFFACVGMAQTSAKDDSMSSRAMELSEMLSVPLSSSSPCWTESLFFTEETIYINKNRIAKKNVVEQAEPFGNSIEFIMSDDKIEAYGKLFERHTFNDAKIALLLELVQNSMMVKDIVKYNYKMYPNEIGDFCIIRTKTDAMENIRLEVPSILHFVRGNKSISLHGKDGADVRLFAKTLDGFLIEKTKNNSETLPQKSSSVIMNEEQEINIQNLVVEKKSSLSDDTAPSSIPPEEEKAFSLKSLNRIWLYLGIGVIFLFAFFYFFRKKTKQENP